MKSEAPPQLPIFRSDGQARLLACLFLHGPPLSLTELQGATGLSAGAVHREVERLERAGLVSSERVGRTRLVHPDETSPFHPELRALLTKAFGPVTLLRAALREVPGIDEAFIYGSWAAQAVGRGERAPRDVDLMVVGSPELDRVYDACRRVENEIGLPVNPTVMSRAEWKADESGFAAAVRKGSRVPVLDDSDG